MLAIADNANSDGYAWPGIKTMADMCNCSERQVTRIVAELEASGELYVERGVGRKNHTRYLITLGLDTDQLSQRMVQYLDYSPLEAVTKAADHLEIKGDISGEKVTTASPFEWTKKGDISGEKVTNSAEKVTSVSPDPIDPLEDPSTRDATRAHEPTVAAPAKTAAAAAVAPSEYQAVVKAYQNEIGMLTPIISDGIKAQMQQSPTEWVIRAIGIAAMRNNRRWAYVEGILRRWQTEGFDGDMDNLSARTGNAAKSGSKSMGYGRQMQQATSKKGPPKNEYENDPEYIAFLASFNDRTADGAAIPAD
jgi:DnaD/phage-associated family protein